MSRRFQFSSRALLVFMLAFVFFFGGIRVERERRRRADEAAAQAIQQPPAQTNFTIAEPQIIVVPDAFGQYQQRRAHAVRLKRSDLRG